MKRWNDDARRAGNGVPWQNRVWRGWMLLWFCSWVGIFPLLQGCTEKNIQASSRSTDVPVLLGQVTLRRVENVLEQIGTLKARQHVLIRSEAQGAVTKILFSEGRDVRHDEILVQIDSSKIEAQIQNLEAKINQLQIRLDNKLKELDRNQPLLKQNLVSPQVYDNLQTDIQETRSEITQAQADLTLQKKRLADTVIRAPFDGVAGARNISIGDYIESGDSVVEVVTLDPLEIQFRVSEKFIPALSIGQTVQIRVDAYPNEVFQGLIFFLSPTVEVVTRTTEVKAQLGNQDRRLSPGMFARVQLVISVHENAVTIPSESIIQAEDEIYVYVVREDNTAHKVPIVMGQSNDEWSEIVEGDLHDGDRVIVEGKYAVREGAKVIVNP